MTSPPLPPDPSIGSNGFAGPGYGPFPDDEFETSPRRRPLRQVVGAIIAAVILLLATVVARPILTEPSEPERSPVPTSTVSHPPSEDVTA